ncbi:MAG: hypothetical protein A3H32_18770 [Betaproteobacteria bacterium RIFCSPLOWO2_02_FULL_63_19]|nr:MAG: hypothetical protein A3H32_18770 [Betaproteobacteria bacterium RIFCSPLOWO2_02_FULL_63_19]
MDSPTKPDTASRGHARVQRLLDGPLGPTLLWLSLPNIVLAAASTAMIVADAWYVGRLGVAPLASLALVFPIQQLMAMMSAGAMGGGIASAIARALGAGDRPRAEALVLHALIIALAMAALYTLLFAVFARPVFALFGGRGAALDGAVGYAEILFGGAVVTCVTNSLASVLRGTGNMIVPAATLIATSVLHVVLSGALTLGWLGLPSLGVRGPAASFVATVLLAGAVMVGYLASGAAGLSLRLRGVTIQRALFADILRVGGVASGNALLTIATIVIVTALVGRYGTAALAGYGLGSRLELMLIPIAFGVGGALTAIVGTNFGARRFARTRRAAWIGGLAVFAVTAALGVTVSVAPHLWIGLFTDDAAAAQIGRLYLRIAGACYAFFAAGMTLYFASQGTGTMLWPFTAGMIRLAVAAGIGAAVALWLDADLAWLFGCVALGLVLFGTVIAYSLFTRAWNPEQR